MLASVRALEEAVVGGDLRLAREAHATIGRLLEEGKIDEAAPAPVAEKQEDRRAGPGLRRAKRPPPPELDEDLGGAGAAAAGPRKRGA